jgi:hypothetical protein
LGPNLFAIVYRTTPTFLLRPAQPAGPYHLSTHLKPQPNFHLPNCHNHLHVGPTDQPFPHLSFPLCVLSRDARRGGARSSRRSPWLPPPLPDPRLVAWARTPRIPVVPPGAGNPSNHPIKSPSAPPSLLPICRCLGNSPIQARRHTKSEEGRGKEEGVVGEKPELLLHGAALARGCHHHPFWSCSLLSQVNERRRRGKKGRGSLTRCTREDAREL